MKLNQFGRLLLTNSFFFKMVQMRRCFQARCTKPVHEEKNIQKMCRFNKESGRSMVEMLGVLAIIGVLSIGGIAGYSKAMEKYKLNKTIEEITTTAQNVRILCSAHNTCNWTPAIDHISNADLIRKLQILPDNMWDKGSDSLTSPFGTEVNFRLSSTLARITYYKVPKNICTGLLSADWTHTGLLSLGIANNNSGSVSGSPLYYSREHEKYAKELAESLGEPYNWLPIALDDISTFCNNVEFINFTFLSTPE